MKEQNIAKVYAKAFLELAKDLKVDVVGEFTKLTEVINSSNDLENLIFLEVFTTEEKKAVLSEIFEKCKFSQIFRECLFFLINERRIGLINLVFKELIVMEDFEMGFINGKIEGATATISEADLKVLENFITAKTNKKLKVKYEQNSGITAGYKLLIDDLQLDASIDSQLKKFKDSIIGTVLNN